MSPNLKEIEDRLAILLGEAGVETDEDNYLPKPKFPRATFTRIHGILGQLRRAQKLPIWNLWIDQEPKPTWKCNVVERAERLRDGLIAIAKDLDADDVYKVRRSVLVLADKFSAYCDAVERIAAQPSAKPLDGAEFARRLAKIKCKDHPEEFLKVSEAEQEAILAWIRASLCDAKTAYRGTSYGLKHQVERNGEQYTFYVWNAVFKGAMLRSGYIPVDASELNWRFRCRPRVKTCSTLYGPRDAQERFVALVKQVRREQTEKWEAKQAKKASSESIA